MLPEGETAWRRKRTAKADLGKTGRQGNLGGTSIFFGNKIPVKLELLRILRGKPLLLLTIEFSGVVAVPETEAGISRLYNPDSGNGTALITNFEAVWDAEVPCGAVRRVN